MGEGGPIRTDRADRTAILTLSRPKRLNAVSGPLYESLLGEVRRLGSDRDVRVIVLTGEGRAFCVGADLKDHGARSTSSGEQTEGDAVPEWRRRYVRLGQLANLAIQRCPKPVVAAVNGHAIGAGLELALSCDLLVVASDAKLRFPEVGLGTFVGGGVTYTLPQRVGAGRAKELLLLGRVFSGDDAVALGLANESGDADRVLDRALGIADELARKAPVSMRHAKRLINRSLHDQARRSLALEADALLECMKTRDWLEGIAAFAEGRPPDFVGE